jgi:hypothetical protein
VHFLAYFFGGVLLANAIPHFVNGVMGKPFQSPFAQPPGKGLSTSFVNVLWGFFNLAIGWLLVGRVGVFEWHAFGCIAPLGLGVLATALLLARTFAPLHGGNLPRS